MTLSKFTISPCLSYILKDANMIERDTIKLTNLELHLYLVNFLDKLDAWKDRCQKLIRLTHHLCIILGLPYFYHRSTIFFSSFFTLIKRLHCSIGGEWKTVCILSPSTIHLPRPPKYINTLDSHPSHYTVIYTIYPYHIQIYQMVLPKSSHACLSRMWCKLLTSYFLHVSMILLYMVCPSWLSKIFDFLSH